MKSRDAQNLYEELSYFLPEQFHSSIVQADWSMYCGYEYSYNRVVYAREIIIDASNWRYRDMEIVYE